MKKKSDNWQLTRDFLRPFKRGILFIILGAGLLLWLLKSFNILFKLLLGCLFAILTSKFIVKKMQKLSTNQAIKDTKVNLGKIKNEKIKPLKLKDLDKGKREKSLDELESQLSNVICKFYFRNKTLPTWLGTLEQLLYIPVIVIGQYGFIAIWLGLKTAGIWKIWGEERDRLSYNTYVIGNALSLINALYWAILIRPEIFNPNIVSPKILEILKSVIK